MTDEAADLAALFARALAAHEAGRLGEAVELYRSLLADRPDLNGPRINLAAALNDLDRPAEGLACLEGLPATAAVLINRANALRGLGRFAEALAATTQAVALEPDDPRALSNLALVNQDLGRLDEAVALFAQAVARAPGEESLRANLGGALLMAGDFERGWPAFEARLAGSATRASMRQTGLPLWSGEPLAGARILIHAEQGLGDTIQFLRFLPLVAKRGGQVIFSGQEGLRRLVSGIEGVQAAIGWNDVPPPCDCQAPLLSLPRLFGVTPAAIPASDLYADPTLVAAWQARIGGEGFKVGLAWQGNPAMKADAKRSVPLERLRPLAALPGVSLFGLQKGAGREGIADVPQDDLGPDLADLADTAAAMAHLDLVIAVDSAVAHLAGALGRPVWTLVRFNPDWRWPPGATRTPWYSTMTLYRQERPNDWETVISRVAADLGALARARTTCPR